MGKKVGVQVKEIIEQLQEEGYPISLIDCSNEGDGEVWVAYALYQNHDQVLELKKYLSETGKLLEPAADLIESIDDLYSSLKTICTKASA